MFLGLVLPQLGVEKQALKSERYLRMDRSAGQSVDDEWFVPMAKESSGAAGHVSVFVNAGHVSAIVITAGKFKQELDEEIERDSRCKRTRGEGFDCRLGGPLGAVNVETCGHFVVVYSDAVPQGRAQKSAYCGSDTANMNDREPTQESWIQRWLAPDRSLPLAVTSVALIVGSWFVMRRRSR
jgi:hypothetical protein